MNETYGPFSSEAKSSGIIQLSPAVAEEALESAACGIQCDCNVKW